MQCQFGILEDSLTFLLGDLKKIKIYNIFRLLFLVTPQTDHMASSARMENVHVLLLREGACLFFLIPLFSNRMLPPPHPDSVGCVCISVPASVENNIVKGNQPSVSVLVWGDN